MIRLALERLQIFEDKTLYELHEGCPWTTPCPTAQFRLSASRLSSGHQGTINDRGVGVYRRQTSKCGRWIATCVPSGATHRKLKLPRMRSCYLLKLVSVIKYFPRLKDKNPFNEQSLSSNHSACEDLNEIQTDCRQGRLTCNIIILMEYIPEKLKLKCYHSTDLYTSIKYKIFFLKLAWTSLATSL